MQRPRTVGYDMIVFSIPRGGARSLAPPYAVSGVNGGVLRLFVGGFTGIGSNHDAIRTPDTLDHVR